MDFMQLAKERYSVRKFAGRAVEKEKIDAILEAARLAPTACNNQPQRIYVVQDAAMLEKLKSCTKYTFGAPLIFVVCYDNTESWKRSYDGMDGGPTDASIVVAHMMLELVELGLGSTWVGSFDPAGASAALGLPEHIVPHALLPVGYPAADAQPAPGHAQRKAMEETVTFVRPSIKG